MSHVAVGTQGMADIPVGNYADVVATETGGPNQVARLGNVGIDDHHHRPAVPATPAFTG